MHEYFINVMLNINNSNYFYYLINEMTLKEINRDILQNSFIELFRKKDILVKEAIE